MRPPAGMLRPMRDDEIGDQEAAKPASAPHAFCRKATSNMAKMARKTTLSGRAMKARKSKIAVATSRPRTYAKSPPRNRAEHRRSGVAARATSPNSAMISTAPATGASGSAPSDRSQNSVIAPNSSTDNTCNSRIASIGDITELVIERISA